LFFYENLQIGLFELTTNVFPTETLDVNSPQTGVQFTKGEHVEVTKIEVWSSNKIVRGKLKDGTWITIRETPLGIKFAVQCNTKRVIISKEKTNDNVYFCSIKCQNKIPLFFVLQTLSGHCDAKKGESLVTWQYCFSLAKTTAYHSR
jgi:hypothetical protein